MSTVTSPPSVAARMADCIEKHVGPQRFEMWFNRSVKLDFEGDGQLRVTVPNQFVARWIDANLMRELRTAAGEVLGQSVQLSVHVDGATQREAKSSAEHRPANQAGPMGSTKKVLPRTAAGKLKHRLDDFVVGPSNELAYSAAIDLADAHRGGANALFLHGGCGLGKTHLLQGICRRMLAGGGGRVRYTTGERFTNEFLSAMRAGTLDAFRAKVRGLDLLAIDDVHFLAGKKATQKEFQHSFDAIDLSGARVVMASDHHPKLIEKLHATLISRCIRGMVVQITPPARDTRRRMITVLAERRGLALLDSVADVLTERCRGSVREIEGTLTKLHTLVRLMHEKQAGAANGANGSPPGQPVGHAILDRLFDEPSQPRRRAVRFDQIATAVTGHFHIERALIAGNSRRRDIVHARALTLYLARKMTSMSYPELAAAIGRKGHSTVVGAVGRIESLVRQNGSSSPPCIDDTLGTRELVEQLKHRILTGP